MAQNAFPKKKDPAPDAQTCAHCLAVLGRAGATILKCARCGLVAYCSKDCQLIFRRRWVWSQIDGIFNVNGSCGTRILL